MHGGEGSGDDEDPLNTTFSEMYVQLLSWVQSQIRILIHAGEWQHNRHPQSEQYTDIFFLYVEVMVSAGVKIDGRPENSSCNIPTVE